MIHKLILALLLVVAGMLGVAMWRMERNRPPNITEILEALRDDKVNLHITNSWSNGMQSYTSKWKDANGIEHSVTTNRNEGESTEDFLARHTAAVNALKEEYPPA